MPFEIDTEKIADPKKVLDIANPPVRAIPYNQFPKMVYLHPEDPTETHKTAIVHTQAELDEHLAAGFVVKPHIPKALTLLEIAQRAKAEKEQLNTAAKSHRKN